MSDLPVLRIFLSSPADLGPERDVVERIVARLAEERADEVTLQLIRWEQLERRAELGGFQDGIDQTAAVSDCALLIGLLWTRLGVTLPEDQVAALPWQAISDRIGPWNSDIPVTGTVYEWLMALAHVPDVEVKLFRKTARPPVIDSADDDQAAAQIEQRRLTRSFWDHLVRGDDGSFRLAHLQFDDQTAFAADIERELRLWLARRLGGDGLPPPVTWTTGSPWRGLAAFDPEHAAVFFGRDRERDDVLDALRQEAAKDDGRTFALIVGLSGAGKSSLVRAGIIPHLPRSREEDGLPVRWHHAIALPGDGASDGDPVAAIIRALRLQAFPDWKHGQGDDAVFAERVAKTPDLLVGLVQAQLAQLGPTARCCLVLDQLEELATAVSSKALQAACVAVMDGLAAAGVWVNVSGLRWRPRPGSKPLNGGKPRLIPIC